MHSLNNQKWILLVAGVFSVIMLAAMSANHSPVVMKLYELPKDIVRDAVPVTGKVRGLQPPKLGEHQHPH